MPKSPAVSVSLSRSDDLEVERLEEVRSLLLAAFAGHFDEDDWNHAVGGDHVLARDPHSGALAGHASVVGRVLRVGHHHFQAGYVEAVSTCPDWQGRGVGRMVMEEVSRVLRSRYELGALATGAHAFYRRLGWEGWQGPTSTYDTAGTRPTPDEDGAVMVLRFGPSAGIDLTLPISAPARSGADW